jgi:hypothetical protein
MKDIRETVYEGVERYTIRQGILQLGEFVKKYEI